MQGAPASPSRKVLWGHVTVEPVDLPVLPPVKPMLAKAVHEVPHDAGLLFEPKWDGFRCIVFRDGDEIELGSRNDRPLTRYFPELVDLLRGALPERCVIDGEIVVVTEGGLDFDALQQRLHPAESRVRMLAEKTPASFVAFDLLALDDRDLTGEPFATRRRLLEQELGNPPRPRAPHADDRRPRGGGGLVRALRGRRLRWCDGQAGRSAVPAGQARDVEGEARAHG